MKPNQLGADLLKKTIEAYLALAYPNDTRPPQLQAICRLEGLASGASGDALLAWQPFEREPADLPVAQARRFQLRLGNEKYPHMKLSVDRLGEELVFEVDTHDQHLPPGTGSERLRVVQEYNEGLKRRIEERWAEQGLDTARGRLRAFSRQAAPPSPQTQRGYALLVDDDPDILDVERLLVEGEGFEVLTAQGVEEALTKVEACGQPLALAIIDIMIPGESGYDLLERLRSCDLLGGPVLFLTAMMDAQVRRGLADGVIHKPFQVEELRQSLRRALSGART